MLRMDSWKTREEMGPVRSLLRHPGEYDGGLKWDGSSRGDVKQSDPGCILKVEPAGFAPDLDVAQERGTKDHLRFWA